MKTFEELPYHPMTETLVDYICTKTGNSDRTYFRVLVSFYIAQVASMMGTKVKTLDRGTIPVNLYAICAAPSGYGKGYGMHVMEEEVMSEFREEFLDITFPQLAEQNLVRMGNKRAIQKGTDPDYEIEKCKKEFEQQGELLFSFDSGTSAALKQMRSKLLYASAGSCNFIMDELGSNLEGNTELLNSYLELYDKGLIKQKLVKNTNENQRYEDLRGATPTNMLAFGTQSKLLDGGKVESAFMTFLETGYARRCFVAIGEPQKQQADQLTPEQVLDELTNSKLDSYVQNLQSNLRNLADPQLFGQVIPMTREANLAAIAYRLHCESLASALPEHAVIHIPEVSHRFFKTLKLAGAYAFIHSSPEVTLSLWEYAVKQSEESGKAFRKMMNREKPYVRLAKYITTVGEEVTQADLVEELPFYKGSASQKNEMMALASAWSFKNNRVIKKSYIENVEVYSGSYLNKTNLDELILSYSQHKESNYDHCYVKFNELGNLTAQKAYYWTNHHYAGQTRNALHLKEGFNLVIAKVDTKCTVEQLKLLLGDYTYHLHKTISDTTIVFPLSHTVLLNPQEYKEFLSSFYDFLPFKVQATEELNITHPWETSVGVTFEHEGELIPVFPFIPKTTKRKEYLTTLKELDCFHGMEKWFALRMQESTRQEEITTYGKVLLLGGMSLIDASSTLKTFNSKLTNKMSNEELEQTILQTLATTK